MMKGYHDRMDAFTHIESSSSGIKSTLYLHIYLSPVYNQSSPIRGSGANATQEINHISNNCTKEGLIRSVIGLVVTNFRVDLEPMKKES